MSKESENPTTFKEGVEGVLRHVRPYRGLTTFMVGLGLISAVANGLVPYVTGGFFDSLIALSQGESREIAGLAAWGAFLAAWALIQVVANAVDWIGDRRRRELDTRLHLGVQADGFIHLLQLPVSYHANEHMSGIMSKFSMASWRISAIVRWVSSIGPQMVSVAIGIALAASISLPLAGVLATGVALYTILMLRMVKPAAAADDIAHKTWNDSWNDAAEAVQQVTSVKQATAEEHEIRSIRGTLAGRAYELWYGMEMLWSNVGSLQRVIVFFTQLTIFILAAQMVANGTLTVGELIALNGYALMFFGPFVQLGYSWQTIQNGLTSAGQVERIFREPTERYHPVADFVPPQARGQVVFEHVGFAYEEGQPRVLEDIDFAAEPGTVVALVGESGAGKSTIAQLIGAYHFPSTGTVRVDGVDTREWDLIELRSRIAVVPQEVALFNASIRDNMRYGAFSATDEQVEEAARRARIDEFIATLPQGYDTLVGERGIKLSVGQKQRIAIARAMLRDPRILILDEPTSALDAETERHITASLDELMQGRTTFVIAHRLSTVRKADQILVLKDGVIAERGRHDELLAIPDGSYRRLYELHIGLHE